jgi:hypothetical protein
MVRVRPGPGKPGMTSLLPDLLRGLRAGDLGTVLLAVEMAADQNLLPCTSPEEEERILAFLGRLAALDALLPPPLGGTG